MVRTTDHSKNARRRPLEAFCALVATCLLAVLVVALGGCAGANKGATTTAPKPKEIGKNMAGPQVQVSIPASVLAAKPRPWNLATPESAVSSYLDWTAYAYRTATSDVATPTMNGAEGVRVDSYVQYNLEKKRLLDEKLTSVTFGNTSAEGTRTIVPTHEKWTYNYRSLAQGNKILSGPYEASYDATYSVVRLKNGWVVDAVQARPLGTVK